MKDGFSRHIVSLRDALESYFGTRRELVADDPGTIVGRTGFIDLDKLLGTCTSDFIVLAGDAKVRTNIRALDIARAAAHGAPVLMFSLRDTALQVTEHMLVAESGVSTNRLYSQWTGLDERLIMEAVGRLADLPIFIYEPSILTADEMIEVAIAFQEEHKLGLIVLDDLQMLRDLSAEHSEDERQDAMNRITRSIKAATKTLDVPILVISQLRTDVGHRWSPTPRLSDLPDGNSIEQDADVILLPNRPDLEFTEEEWERQNPIDPYPKNVAEVFVAKHRHGPTGKVHLVFRGQVSSFVDLYREVARR